MNLIQKVFSFVGLKRPAQNNPPSRVSKQDPRANHNRLRKTNIDGDIINAVDLMGDLDENVTNSKESTQSNSHVNDTNVDNIINLSTLKQDELTELNCPNSYCHCTDCDIQNGRIITNATDSMLSDNNRVPMGLNQGTYTYNFTGPNTTPNSELTPNTSIVNSPIRHPSFITIAEERSILPVIIPEYINRYESSSADEVDDDIKSDDLVVGGSETGSDEPVDEFEALKNIRSAVYDMAHYNEWCDLYYNDEEIAEFASETSSVIDATPIQVLNQPESDNSNADTTVSDTSIYDTTITEKEGVWNTNETPESDGNLLNGVSYTSS